MKRTAFAMVLAIGMALSCFAEDGPAKVEFDGVIQQLPAGQLIGMWMVSEKAVVVTEGTVIEEDDGPIRVGARVEVEGLLGPDGSITARKIETEN